MAIAGSYFNLTGCYNAIALEYTLYDIQSKNF